MFLITAFLLTVAATVFLIFGSGERQSWAIPLDDSIPLARAKELAQADKVNIAYDNEGETNSSGGYGAVTNNNIE